MHSGTFYLGHYDLLYTEIILKHRLLTTLFFVCVFSSPASLTWKVDSGQFYAKREPYGWCLSNVMTFVSLPMFFHPNP